MSIVNVGPNRWKIVVCVRVNKRSYPIKKQETIPGTKQDAEVRRAEIVKELRSSRFLKASHIYRTFSDAVELFTEKRGPFSLSHARKIYFLERETGHLALYDFPDRFEAWLRILKSTPTIHNRSRSAASLNRYIEIVRSVFGLLVRLEIIETNPITKTRFPKGETKPRDRFLTIDERSRLIGAIMEHRPYILPFVEYSMAVPCRKMELLSAKREQYNPDTNTVYIPDSKAGIPITKPIPPAMVRYFQTIPRDSPHLFYRRDRSGRVRSLGPVRKSWSFCLKKAGLSDVRIHDLRHLAASDLYAAGIPEREIMDIAGWKTPMLSTYRHRDSLKSAQRINSLFERSEASVPASSYMPTM
jgi:integrase